MFDLKLSKQLGTIYLLKSLNSFLPFLWYCHLTIDLVISLIFGCKGTGMGHRIAMIPILWNNLAILFEGLRSFWKATFDSIIEGLWSCIWFLCAKTYHMHNMAILVRQQSSITRRVQVCNCVWFTCIIILD